MLKKAWKFCLILPVFVAFALAANAVSYTTTGAPTARPSTAAARISSLGSNVYSNVYTAAATAAGLSATCANPLPDRLTSNRCISRYESCLKGENVCGSHFELCYDKPQFNRVKIMCQDILSQCPADAIKSLYGVNITTSDDFSAANRTMCDGESKLTARSFARNGVTISLADLGTGDIATDSRIDLMIKEGNDWAAANSVKTCNNVADACIQNACEEAPQKCISPDGFSDIDKTQMVNVMSSGATNVRIDANMLSTWIDNMSWGESEVRGYLKEKCLDVIGANKWCNMVTNNGKAPTESDLMDSFNIEDVYDDIMYTGIGPRWKMAQSKIKEMAATATQSSIDQCRLDLETCVVNACGEGSKARCYGLAKQGNTVSIKNRAGDAIIGQCKNLIENNQYCKDVFLPKDSKNTSVVWKRIWDDDAMGAIVGLDQGLQQMFNEQSVADMRASCQATASQCVKQMCGDDYSGCFLSSQAAGDYQNKVVKNGVVSGTSYSGGFDVNMARDLCMMTIKTASTCTEYFDVQYAKQSSGVSADAWGTANSVRNAWGTSTSGVVRSDGVCRVSDNYISAVDSNGNAIDATQKITTEDKNCAKQEYAIFDELMADTATTAQGIIEREANQLKNDCENKNVKGSASKDYIWASLSNLDSSDEFNGFDDVTATSDPFGGFCAVRVRIASNNDKVMKALGGDSTGKIKYYPKGVNLVCNGLTDSQLKKIENELASELKTCKTGQTPEVDGCVAGIEGIWWKTGLASLGGAAVTGLGGILAGNAIQNSMNTGVSSLTADEQYKLSMCQACVSAGGKGYSKDTACYPDASNTADADAAAAMCNASLAQLNTKVAGAKNNLMSLNTDGGKWGGIIGAGVGAIGVGVATNVALNNKEDSDLSAARQAAIENFYANTNINCYVGGKKVAAFGDEFTIK
ncbi:MAG: hypothetical protein LBL75_00950 [Rickettsiales bacterium]|jgi:hypothetical protein|nr:hypothetical protein [Rickettsiales bacterium]